MHYLTERPPDWMKWLLRAAGTWHLAFAVIGLFFPAILLRYLIPGQPAPPQVALEFLGAAALLTAALGAGFLFAASHVFRHWPVVLMGFLAKVALGAGLGLEIVRHRLDPAAWLIVILDNLVWTLAFAVLLHATHEMMLRIRRTVSPDVLRFALRRKTQYGITLDEHSRLTPVLLVFLRHTGCMFCREALSDLARMQPEVEAQGARLVLVHMGREPHAANFFTHYGLENVPRIGDPERTLYRAFALSRGSLLDLFGPKVWWRAFQVGILGRHGMGRPVGDAFQMPGAFLLFHGEIVRTYRHQSPADRPDYLALVTGRDYAAPELRDS
ncbi:SelL-related redox protein [Paludibaculum fermentans]|uniref:Redoxin domain-containing protein n=1 Tax=Paludibaculum fermentans TaxID=1473598 RepID=A0A7S7NUC9_PALFE|nr:SelL-related redox protein [Paludibaculum fermentans]QOY89891.1 redoxin domain-containing protein [Paludibaculum fermentans]